MLNRRIKFPVTELNKNDRRILHKYTGFYSNFIESNTAKAEILEDERHKGKSE